MIEKLDKSSYIETLLVSILLVVGMYLPSSINRTIMPSILVLLHYGIILTIFIYMWIKHKSNNKTLFLMFILINISLIYSTVGSSIVYGYPLAIGAYLPYIVISILYLIDLKAINVDLWIEKVFNTINIINIGLSVLLILGIAVVQNFFYDWYLNFYEEILWYMFNDNKPILTFVSHSIASLYMFIFFFLNYYTYVYRQNKLSLYYSICYIIILFFMTSNAGYVFMILSVLVIILDKRKIISKYLININDTMKKYKNIVAIAGIIVIIASVVILNTSAVQSYIAEMNAALNSNFNGFKGRFGSDLFYKDIDYIRQNLLLPVGVTYVDGLHYTDNGFIVTMLRGGVVLTVGLYYGLYVFFKSNIIDRKISRYVFLAYIIFEVAHPNLEFSRTLYLIPFIVIYLNYLIKNKKIYS